MTNPLHEAARMRNAAGLARLIEAGADVNERGPFDRTPLHNAARYHDDPALIRLLVRLGADLGVTDRWGCTPLEIARRRHHAAAAEALETAALGADHDDDSHLLDF